MAAKLRATTFARPPPPQREDIRHEEHGARSRGHRVRHCRPRGVHHTAAKAGPDTGTVPTSAICKARNLERGDNGRIAVHIVADGDDDPRGKVAVRVVKNVGDFRYINTKEYDGGVFIFKTKTSTSVASTRSRAGSTASPTRCGRTPTTPTPSGSRVATDTRSLTGPAATAAGPVCVCTCKGAPRISKAADRMLR